QPKQKGRARQKGKRLPTLEQRLHDTKTTWHRVLIPNWYGEGQRLVEICSDLAVWYHSGQPTVLLRWVLIRDPQGKLSPKRCCARIPMSLPSKLCNGLFCVGNWK